MYLSMPDENLLLEIGKFSDITHIIIKKTSHCLQLCLGEISSETPREDHVIGRGNGINQCGCNMQAQVKTRLIYLCAEV